MRLQDILELSLFALICGASFLFMRIATPQFGVIPLMELRLAIVTLAYVLFFRLIVNLGASRVVTVTYFIPVFAMVPGAIFLQEEITTQMFTGGAMILLGTALATGMLKGLGKLTARARQAENAGPGTPETD